LSLFETLGIVRACEAKIQAVKVKSGVGSKVAENLRIKLQKE
jgi:hypothetical protein